jgi:hypothetical protein
LLSITGAIVLMLVWAAFAVSPISRYREHTVSESWGNRRTSTTQFIAQTDVERRRNRLHVTLAFVVWLGTLVWAARVFPQAASNYVKICIGLAGLLFASWATGYRKIGTFGSAPEGHSHALYRLSEGARISAAFLFCYAAYILVVHTAHDWNNVPKLMRSVVCKTRFDGRCEGATTFGAGGPCRKDTDCADGPCLAGQMCMSWCDEQNSCPNRRSCIKAIGAGKRGVCLERCQHGLGPPCSLAIGDRIACSLEPALLGSSRTIALCDVRLRGGSPCTADDVCQSSSCDPSTLECRPVFPVDAIAADIALLKDGTLGHFQNQRQGAEGYFGKFNAISGAGKSICVRLPDGTVKCSAEGKFFSVSDLSRVTDVAVGSRCSCALLEAGTVKCWEQRFSHLGAPRLIEGLSGVKAVSVGTNVACALGSDESVKCWVWSESCDYSGAIDAKFNTSRLPTQIAGLAHANAIAVGLNRGWAILDDGSVLSWPLRTDSGNFGSLNPGKKEWWAGVKRWFDGRPAPVEGLKGAKTIRAGVRHTCGVFGESTVQCWTDDGKGEQAHLPGVTAVFPDLELNGWKYTACAVVASGTVKCWLSTASMATVPVTVAAAPFDVDEERAVIE